MTQITLSEVSRAIFLDFEGNASSPRTPEFEPPPILGGTICDKHYDPVLLDPALRNAATAREWACMEIGEYLASLLAKAEREDRRIVHWSSREATVFEDQGLTLGIRGFDARKLAKPRFPQEFKRCREARRVERDGSAGKTEKAKAKRLVLLVEVARAVGCNPPHGYGFHCAGKWVSAAIKQANRHDRYTEWSRGGKAKLTKLVNHNRFDCEATQFVLQQVLQS